MTSTERLVALSLIRVISTDGTTPTGTCAAGIVLFTGRRIGVAIFSCMAADAGYAQMEARLGPTPLLLSACVSSIGLLRLVRVCGGSGLG